MEIARRPCAGRTACGIAVHIAADLGELASQCPAHSRRRRPRSVARQPAGHDGIVEQFRRTQLFGPEYNFSYWNFIQKDLAPTWWTALARKTLVDTSALSPLVAKTRLANSTYVKQPRPLTDVLVAPAPLDGVAAPSYIADLAGLGWQDLWSPGSGSMPISFCCCGMRPCDSIWTLRWIC